MGHRNVLCNSQMVDLESNRQTRGYLHPEPSFLYGSITNLPAPNVHSILPSGMAANADTHHLMEHHDSALFYGMTQYSGVQHHNPPTNHDLAIASGSTLCNPYLAPSSARVFPTLVNHGSHDQSQLPGNHDLVGVPATSFGRYSYFKRKHADTTLRNIQHFNCSGSSSPFVGPFSARPLASDFAAMDPSSLPLNEYRGNTNSLVMEVESLRSARNRFGAIGLESSTTPITANHLIQQGSYLGQPLQTAGPWVNQQFNSNSGGVGEIGSLTWNQAPSLSYIHGSANGVNGEAGNIGIPVYQVPARIQSSPALLHPPYISHGHPNLSHPPPSLQGLRTQNIDFHPQATASTHRLATSSISHPVMNPFQDGFQTGSRYVAPVPPTGIRIYRPHQRSITLEPSFRQRSCPRLRVLPEDGVAILEIPGYHDIGGSFDHHRDMRLDIEHMSYEELLALGEQIGSVDSGLSEETIAAYLKTRKFLVSLNLSNDEEAASENQEVDFCVICQANYKNEQKIGSLDCGHEYHVDCIKKWLLLKNTCPICKSTALPIERKDL